jgi:hypothetical protein
MTDDVIEDTLFGCLSWDGGSSSWQTRIRLPDGSETSMSIVDENHKGWETVEQARPYFRALQSRYREVGTYVEADLLSDATTNWGVSRAAARNAFRQLPVQQVEIIPDYGTKLYCADNGVFGGHVIVVRMDKDGDKLRVTAEG